MDPGARRGDYPRVRGLATACMAVVAACAAEGPPGPQVVGSEEVEILEQSDAIEGRDGGVSTRVWDRSVWTYGDTVLRVPDVDGRNWHHNSVSVTLDLDASDGITGFAEPLDGAGAPDYLLAPTPEEKAFNDAHWGEECAEEPCGARYAVWPGPPVWDAAGDRALVFYGLIYGEPGDFNFEGRGASIAIWDAPDAVARRPEVDPGAEHPTLVFAQDDPSIGTAAIIEGDHLYSLACDRDGLDHVCRLSRVRLGEELLRDAWRMWDGEAWTDDLHGGAVLFVGAPILSLGRNEALGGWLVVYSPPFDHEIVARTAPDLVGPWSEASVLHRAPKSEDAPYDAVHHAEYEEDGGLVQYVTYSRHTSGWFATEFPVIRVELEAP